MKDFCSCGAAIHLFGGDDALNEELMSAWQRRHAGEGHVRVSATHARYVRNGYKVPTWMADQAAAASPSDDWVVDYRAGRIR